MLCIALNKSADALATFEMRFAACSLSQEFQALTEILPTTHNEVAKITALRRAETVTRSNMKIPHQKFTHFDQNW
jgi:hypothetical protein